MTSKKENRFKKAFGLMEEGLADLPSKISGVMLSRILHGEEMGCSRCFPHGMETRNASRRKNRRSWKYHRSTQYRISSKITWEGINF